MLVVLVGLAIFCFSLDLRQNAPDSAAVGPEPTGSQHEVVEDPTADSPEPTGSLQEVVEEPTASDATPRKKPATAKSKGRPRNRKK